MIDTLLKMAKEQHGHIAMCAGKTSWEECVTVEDCGTIFWFNISDGSTRAIILQ